MRLLGRLLLAFLVFAAALEAVEIGVRIAAPVGSELQPRFAMDDEAGWVWAPNQRGAWQRNYGSPELFKTHFSTNSLGMRDREYTPGKGENVRILALGDSYTEGWGVEDSASWPKLLESQELRGVEVWNLGVVGYSTDQEYELLRRFLGIAHPDVVVLQFYENDIADDLRPKSLWYPRYEKPRFEVRKDSLVLMNPRALRDQRMYADEVAHLRRHYVLDFLERWALYRWARFTYRKITYKPQLQRGASLQQRVWMDENSYRKAQTSRMREGWRITGRLLAEMKGLCAQRRVPFVVVYVPRGIETVPGILQAEIDKAQTGDSAGAFDLTLPERTLDSVAHAEKFPLVKLHDVFRTLPDPAGLYLPILKDGHLTPRGQATVAHQVALALRADSLLPADRFLGAAAPAPASERR